MPTRTQWDWVNPALTSNELRDIAYADTGVSNALVVVGDHGTILLRPAQGHWQIQTSNTLNSLTSIVWGNNQFVAVGQYGTVLRSQNGMNWQAGTIDTEQHIEKVFWNGAKYLALAGSHIFYSDDAVSWQEAVLHLQQDTINWLDDREIGLSFKDIAANDEKLIVVDHFGTILSSENGLQWHEYPRQYTMGSIYFTAITASSTLFLITGKSSYTDGFSGKHINMLSTNGDQWVLHEHDFQHKRSYWDGEI